jgi:16S rRNA (cytidine1402-2'-O)-methyltransferase
MVFAPECPSGIFWLNGKASRGHAFNRIDAAVGTDMIRAPRPTLPDAPASDGARLRRYVIAGQAVEVRPLAAGLYLVATPIGNLRDVSLRALDALAGADLVACEDTRVSRRLLDHYGIATPLTPYHEHNAEKARPRLLARLASGAALALISDAGTPLISDPGYKLVRAARDAGHTVTPIPGASAPLAALVASGLPTDRFFFEGFLPPKAAARRSRIAAIAAIPATLLLFETGPRLAETLADLAAQLGARRASVCRELTKLHEEIRCGNLPALAGDYARLPAPRGEIVLVVAPPDTAAYRADERDVDALLKSALARVSVKDAVSEVAAATGHPRRAVYQRALALMKERTDDAPA